MTQHQLRVDLRLGVTARDAGDPAGAETSAGWATSGRSSWSPIRKPRRRSASRTATRPCYRDELAYRLLALIDRLGSGRCSGPERFAPPHLPGPRPAVLAAELGVAKR